MWEWRLAYPAGIPRSSKTGGWNWTSRSYTPRGKSLTAAFGWKLGTARLCDWPATGPWSRWMTEHRPEYLRSNEGLGVRKRWQGEAFNIPVCVCGSVRAEAALPSFRHSWEATELVKTTRFDRSLLSFIVFLFLPPLEQLPEDRRWDEGRERVRSHEDKWDKCGKYMKTRTLFKGSPSK